MSGPAELSGSEMSVILVLCVFGRELTDIHCCALVQQVGLSPPNLPYVGVPVGPKVGRQSPYLPPDHYYGSVPCTSMLLSHFWTPAWFSPSA